MIFFKPSRAVSMARKELKHILRDPFTLALALGLPVVLVTFFGFAIDFDIRDIKLVTQDEDRSRYSRQLAEIFSSSGYFRLTAPSLPGRVLHELDSERADGVMVIKPGFGRDIASGRQADIQLILDGADNSKTMAITGYLADLKESAQTRLTGAPSAPPLAVKTRFLFNPELNTRWFIIPGLAVIVIGLLAILMTALTVAREWENGSMELLLSTPVRPMEIIAGKLAPYIAVGLAGVLFVYIVARAGFSVPFRGSHLFFLAACLMFLTACLSQGLLISVATRQQQLAMQFSMISGLLPSMLLSGFIFPVESMPVFFQHLTSILPPKWFMLAARGIFLKGAGPAQLAVPLAALLVMDIVLITAAAKCFKTDLE